MIHRLSFKGRLHGWHLVNVQVDCREVLKQAAPVDTRRVTNNTSGEVCETCKSAGVPASYSIVYLEEKVKV